MAGAFPPDKMKAWTQCADAKFAPATGDWQVQLRGLADGRRLARWPNGYVWGPLEFCSRLYGNLSARSDG